MCEFASLQLQIIRNESKPIMDMFVATRGANQLSILFIQFIYGNIHRK